MANSADPVQLASSDLDLHCLQKQGISRFSRTRVKKNIYLATPLIWSYSDIYDCILMSTHIISSWRKKS